LHLLLEHLDLQEHFKNPCPPDKDWLEAASRTLMVVSQFGFIFMDTRLTKHNQW
jgi:hypothetical protein